MSFFHKNPSLKENVLYKEGGFTVSNGETVLEINDYLDLYLLAKSMDDRAWQEEILKKLQNYNQNHVNHTQMIHNLWSAFKWINEELLELYHQLRTDSTNSYLAEKIMDLKQKRIEITRQLRMEEKPSIETK